VSEIFSRNWFVGRSNAVVPRQRLTFARLDMPMLRDSQLRQAVRLQLGPYAGGLPFAFVCKRQSNGQVAAWIWALGPPSEDTATQWPEPLLDAPDEGLRLVQRSSGFEAQHWRDHELLHSRWFAVAPDLTEWQRFARGCGHDPDVTPPPQPSLATARTRPDRRNWLTGDSLPAKDPWRGWRWQAALLLLGAVMAAAAGFHWQTRQQLTLETQRLAALRAGRETALRDKSKHDQIESELQTLRALTPRLIQLDLLDRVIATGIFSSSKTTAVDAAASSPQQAVKSRMASTSTGAQLVEWDYRNGQLKLTLELAGADLTMLEITRRLERISGLGPLRVGQDSGSVLTLSMPVDEVAAAQTGQRRSTP
jgi:hypothetical protein